MIQITIKDFIFSFIAILALIYSLFNKIRYECLRRASELVSSIEKDKSLTGKEKFSLVIVWISEDLPVIFRNEFVKNLIAKLVQYIYDNSFGYAQNYIKRKTGLDIGDITSTLNDKNELDSYNSGASRNANGNIDTN